MQWKKTSQKFNEESGNPKRKKALQCSERWKNVLSNQFKKFFLRSYHFLIFFFQKNRGEWTKREDSIILSFVRENGSKWSRLAKICPHRTEHNVKNRFFSLFSKHFDIPILKVKQSCNYLDIRIIDQVKEGLGL